MNFFEIIANGTKDQREARLTDVGVEVLANRLQRPPSDIEVLNVARKARVAAWNERMINSGAAFDDDKDVVLENNATGITVEIPAEKISNRFVMPADNFYHIAPLGEHTHPKGLLQIIDRESVDSMVKNFKRQAQDDPKFPGLLVDADHKSQSGSTEAMGWITNLQGREDGLWANIKWTGTGEKAVNGGEFRLVSPVWKRSDCEDLGGTRCRPLVLDSVGLVNEPNLQGLTPLTKIA